MNSPVTAEIIRVMTDSAQPTFDYPFDEWHPQMSHFLDVDSANPDTVRDGFRLQYPDPAEADWKAERFWRALTRLREVLADHPGKFEIWFGRKFPGPNARHVIHAFHETYAALPDHRLHEDPPVGVILQLAEESLAKRQRVFRGRAE